MDSENSTIVCRSITIAAPIETVWAAITDADQVARWYAYGGAALDLRVGGAITLQWDEHGAFQGTIETLEPPHRLSYRLANPPSTEPTATNSTVVTFDLTTTGQQTTLTVTETGFDDLLDGACDPSTVAEVSDQGWRGGLEALVSHVMRGHGPA